MGDPAGIGPEVALKAARFMVEKGESLPVLIGSEDVFRRDIKRYGLSIRLRLEDGGDPSTDVRLVESVGSHADPFLYGSPSKESGRAAYESIVRAVELAVKGELDAIVTAPISKLALKEAGIDFPGHTELLAHLTKAPRHAMMLASDRMRVTLVTTHMALSEIPANIKSAGVLDKIELSAIFLGHYLRIESPLIGVCALNPHAGEGGTFGSEETELKQAVGEASARGIRVEGPLPADSLFAHWQKYDCVVANYHDQGLIPIKMLSFKRSVNVTLGLPLIRTSPDHGTAFDIAGKDEASPESMVAAVRFAQWMIGAGRVKWESIAAS
jgi:4-hydroxythreonine-4-phosphate dehydrogenase